MSGSCSFFFPGLFNTFDGLAITRVDAQSQRFSRFHCFAFTHHGEWLNARNIKQLRYFLGGLSTPRRPRSWIQALAGTEVCYLGRDGFGFFYRRTTAFFAKHIKFFGFWITPKSPTWQNLRPKICCSPNERLGRLLGLFQKIPRLQESISCAITESLNVYYRWSWEASQPCQQAKTQAGVGNLSISVVHAFCQKCRIWKCNRLLITEKQRNKKHKSNEL